MANEYLKRTPTSTGNRKVWTWSGWVKRNQISSDSFIFSAGSLAGNWGGIHLNSTRGVGLLDIVSSTQLQVQTSEARRDASSWLNIVVSVDTTKETSEDRVKMHVNGINLTSFQSYTVTQNYNTWVNSLTMHGVGRLFDGAQTFATESEMSDVFFVDGQALTPDVFGFYKQGNGYISAGSTQATDFRPGQWVPKTPRVIKAQIERNGGFGVNGFYLPMNDSSNFGADFHTTPNSIITLKGEDLPQPRNGAPTTTDAYVSQLRTDPYAANLVLALPFVNGGLGTDGTSSGINTGFGDYSAVIKGSGSAKIGTLFGNVSIANTASYYGSVGITSGSDYLRFQDSSDFAFGDGQPFTMEGWFNLTTTSDSSALLISRRGDFSSGGAWGGTTGYQYLTFYYSVTQQIYFQYYNGSSVSIFAAPTGIVTSGQWNHLAIEYEAPNLSMYVNGSCVAISTNPNLVNITTPDRIHVGQTQTEKVYQQDLRVYKGVAKYKGGFDVPKPYTPVGIATWRAVPDTTANNFATWNPISKYSTESSLGLTNGNLTATADASVNKLGTATVGVTTGKWYYEFSSTSANSYFEIGIGTYAGSAASSNGLNYKCYNGNIEIENVSQTTVSSLGANEILGIAFNASDGQTTFYKDGVGIATISFTSSSGLYIPQLQSANGATHVGSANFGQNPTFSGNTTAGTFTDSNGKGLFKYEPPSGFLALCEDNLPTPAIKNPGEYFKTVLYNNATTVTGIGFTPDLIWHKSRTQTYSHYLYDSVRGVGAKGLNSNTTSAEGANDALGILSFDEDGFSFSSDAGLSQTNAVAWCWKAGAGTTSTNTDGSIQSVVSVNQDAGFSIVSYTGDGSDASVGHGLGKTPGLIIIKGRQTSFDWRVWHLSFNTGYDIQLNTTLAVGSAPTVYRASPTSSVVNIGSGTAVNGSGSTYIAYCWAEIEGFSKFGSYVGNGSADGPFIYTGGRPAYVMIKRTDSADDWYIHDSSRTPNNPSNLYSMANLSNIEQQFSIIDFLSNGFKLRNVGGGGYNGSGGTYIYACWMESPFTTANSK